MVADPVSGRPRGQLGDSQRCLWQTEFTPGALQLSQEGFHSLTGRVEPWDLTLSQLGLGLGHFLSAFKYTYNIVNS